MAPAKYVRKSHTNTKQADSTVKTEQNEANTNNYRQLRLRSITEIVIKEEVPGLELCKVEKSISTQKRIPTVIRGQGDISEGSFVLVKWPSFPYWPARVTEICKNMANVIFFGDGGCVVGCRFSLLYALVTIVLILYFQRRTAKVKVDRLFQLTYNTNYIIYILQSQQWTRVYTKAIKEAEICSGTDKSILKYIS